MKKKMNFKDIIDIETAKEFGNDTSLANCFLQIKSYIGGEIFLLNAILRRLELRHSNHVSYVSGRLDGFQKRLDEIEKHLCLKQEKKNAFIQTFKNPLYLTEKDIGCVLTDEVGRKWEIIGIDKDSDFPFKGKCDDFLDNFKACGMPYNGANWLSLFTRHQPEKEIISFPEKFKVGWVYEDKTANEWLIVHIWKDDRDYSIIGVALDHKSTFISNGYTMNGNYFVHKENSGYDLILSTGRPWEPENDKV